MLLGAALHLPRLQESRAVLPSCSVLASLCRSRRELSNARCCVKYVTQLLTTILLRKRHLGVKIFSRGSNPHPEREFNRFQSSALIAPTLPLSRSRASAAMQSGSAACSTPRRPCGVFRRSYTDASTYIYGTPTAPKRCHAVQRHERTAAQPPDQAAWS